MNSENNNETPMPRWWAIGLPGLKIRATVARAEADPSY
jgi:hypothetical protein